MYTIIEITRMTAAEIDALLPIRPARPRYRMPKRGKHTMTRVR